MNKLSNRLIKLKKDKNLLQKDIAKDVNLSAYQYYERGQREPTASVLIALADYFDVSIDYLVGRTDNPKLYK